MKIGRVVLVWIWMLGCGVSEIKSAEGPVVVHPVNGAYVREWLVLGPFPDRGAAVNRMSGVGDEAGVRPKEGDQVTSPDGTALVWKRHASKEDFVNLSAAFGSTINSSAYAFCELETDADGDSVFQVFTHADAGVWVNGAVVSLNSANASVRGLAVATVPLRKGRNPCLVKLSHTLGEWVFYLRILPSHRATIAGRITDPAGTGVAAATVQLFRGDEALLKARSDGAGNYQLDVFPGAGAFELRATGIRVGASRVRLSLAEGERRKVDLRLEDAYSISGTVLTLDGRTPQTSVLVQAMSALEDGSNERVAESVLTDERGDYQLLGLKPGRYRIRCQTQSGYAYYRPTGESLGAAGTELTLGERSYRGINLLVPEIKKGHWKTFSTYDGLPRQNIVSLERLTNGLIYLGFWAGGLCEFDGREFKEIEGLNIPSAGVPALTRDKKGRLWIGSGGNGLRMYDGQGIREFTVKDGLVENGLRALRMDREGNLWIGTRSGLSKYDGEKFSRYRVEDGLSGNWINALCQARDGAIWIANSVGVSRFDGVKFEHFSPERGFWEQEVLSLCEARDGTMWLGTHNGLVGYRDGAFRRLTARDGLGDDFVNDIFEAEDGALWLATSRGLSRYNGNTFVNYTQADGLVNENLRKICPGADGVLWLATADGLSALDPLAFTQWSDKDGLSKADGTVLPISTILDMPKNGIWLSADTQILRCEGDQISRVDGLAGMGALADLHQAADGTIWFAGRGLWKYDGRELLQVSTVLGIREIDMDDRGNIWMGGSDGARRYEPHTGETRLFTSADGLPHTDVWSLRRGLDGTMWVGTYDGLAKFDGSQIVDVREKHTIREQLAVWAMEVDSKGVVSFGGPSDFGRFDGRGFTWPDEKLRLGKPRVWDMSRAADGTLWLATENHGLIGYDEKWNVFTVIDPRDGLAGKNARAVEADSKGQIWVATRDVGLTRYRRGTQLPSVRFVGAEFDDKATNDFSAPLRVTAGHRVTVTCREIDFKTHRDKRQFLYQVRTLDGKALTNSPSGDRHFDWTPSAPGQFEVLAQAIDRDLNYSPPARLTLVALNPWYLNAWIAGPSGAFVVGLFLWAFVARSLYMGKRREAQRLQGQVLAQERRARESLQESYRRLGEAKEAAEVARLSAEEAKEAAVVANRAKSIFLANMSHEIRTPLNAILGYAQILQRDAELPAKQRQAISTIERSGRHLLALINEILDLSKIESGRMELSPADFDLRELIADTAAMFEPRCREKGLRWGIEWNLAPALSGECGVRNTDSELRTPNSALASAASSRTQLQVRGDEGKLRQTLINLVGNAVKFTEHGSVTLRVDRSDAHVYGFEVLDTGPGVAPEIQQRIFEPFTQGTDGKFKGGTGLGLAISRRQIELMGGELGFESKLGHGSRFHFTLRLPPALGEVATKAKRKGGRARRLREGCVVRALAVDDIAENRDVLEQSLKELGVQVTVVNGGEAAWQRLRSERYDIAFLDIQMPDVTGIDVARRVMQEFGPGRVKLVAVSASVLSHEQQEYAQVGFDGFIPKPFRFEHLCECLENLLGAKFEYEAEPSETPESVAPSELSDLSLPAELLGRLKHAAEIYSVTELDGYLSEVETLGETGKELAARLRELSRNVQIDEIVKILGSIQSSQ